MRAILGGWLLAVLAVAFLCVLNAAGRKLRQLPGITDNEEQKNVV
jgi:hypothetical protein